MSSYVLVEILLRMSSKEIRGRNYMDKIETNVISVSSDWKPFDTLQNKVNCDLVCTTDPDYSSSSYKVDHVWSMIWKCESVWLMLDRLLFWVFLSYFVRCTKDMNKQTLLLVQLIFTFYTWGKGGVGWLKVEFSWGVTKTSIGVDLYKSRFIEDYWVK